MFTHFKQIRYLEKEIGDNKFYLIGPPMQDSVSMQDVMGLCRCEVN